MVIRKSTVLSASYVHTGNYKLSVAFNQRIDGINRSDFNLLSGVVLVLLDDLAASRVAFN